MTPLTSSIIMVVGVGGGGGNAVNHMYRQGLTDVSFMVCNTDAQALSKSPVINKVQMGEGLGAGSNPEKARVDAEKSIEEIKEILVVNNIQMVFVTAGMGGGTGTGAAPVIAAAAKEMGILTVAIVTIPFESEGRPRVEQAIEGIAELSKHVDSLIVINNSHIVEIYGDLTFSEAFAKADDILAIAARSISEIIINPHVVNVDFADVTRVMKNSGVAIMGSAIASGEDRAIKALNEAMSSPLLHHRSIAGADQALVNISSCKGEGEITMAEAGLITSYIQEKSDNNNNTNLIWGIGYDDNLAAGEIRATVVATGFDIEGLPSLKEYYKRTMGSSQAEQLEVPAPVYVPKKDVVDFMGNDHATSAPAPVALEASEFEVYEAAPSVSTPVSSVSVHATSSVVRQMASVPTSTSSQESLVKDSTMKDSTMKDSAMKDSTMKDSAGDLSATESVSEEHDQDPVIDTESVAKRSISELSVEELENIPAWKRRQMVILSDSAQGSKSARREREVLNYDDSTEQKVDYHTIDLFEE